MHVFEGVSRVRGRLLKECVVIPRAGVSTHG